MKVNPLFVFPATAVVVGAVVLWRVFTHDISNLKDVENQPPGNYFLLLKETGAGQHEAAIVVKRSNGSQVVVPGVAKGDINSPVVSQRSITYVPTDKGCEGIIFEFLQISGTVKVLGLGTRQESCELPDELIDGAVLKKL
ncbi:hypothetical protein [Pseudomonas viridiflava]|uniref:hypothetical protein n=1 Tax=Pseudomonas viridiflava TaxID=33069 RepID=UPI002EB7D309|nr:hypothetical protein [Pseudomonas viridiflava]